MCKKGLAYLKGDFYQCDLIALKDEYNDRGVPSKGDYARGIGITMPIIGLCGFVPGIFVFAGLAQFILFIIYWNNMSNFKNELKSSSNV